MKKLKIKKIWILVILLFVLGGLGFILFASAPDMVSLPPEEALEKVSIGDVKKIVSVDGNVSGSEEYKLYAPAQAKIISIDVKVGEKVKKNQTLATVEVSGFTGTQEEQIKSPNKGTVTAINFQEDETILTLGIEFIKIVNTDKLIVSSFVNENDVIDLKKNQKAELTFPAISFDRQYEAEVTFIAPESQKGSAVVSYLVEITPEDLPSQIKLGMSASAEILIEEELNVLTVPESFLVSRDDTYYLKVLEYTNPEETDYSITDVEVKIGLITDEFVEILSGVSEGTTIVEPSFTVSRDSFSLFF